MFARDASGQAAWLALFAQLLRIEVSGRPARASTPSGAHNGQRGNGGICGKSQCLAERTMSRAGVPSFVLLAFLVASCSPLEDPANVALLSDLPQGDLGFFGGTGPCLQRPDVPGQFVVVTVTTAAEDVFVERRDELLGAPDRVSGELHAESELTRTRMSDLVANVQRAPHGWSNYCLVLRPEQTLTVREVYATGRALQNLPGATLMLFPELASEY